MATWMFRPPTQDEGPASWEDRLFLRVKLSRGVSIQEKPQGAFRALRFPTQDEISEAFRFFMGGHEYEVDADTRAALIAAGVGVTDANFTLAAASGYGLGLYGSGPYGG
ncbi:hypothetical protein AB0942_33295 [Streptomyces nodosus]|uniref:hypothetical protein n=1 Tax=Streptomyces nodosus TaxID=40318 RepID=UPI003451EC3A